MSETEDFKNVEDRFIHAAHSDIAIVFPDLIDEAHDRAKSGAGNVGQVSTIDYNVMLITFNQILENTFEIPCCMGIYKADGFYNRNISL